MILNFIFWTFSKANFLLLLFLNFSVYVLSEIISYFSLKSENSLYKNENYSNNGNNFNANSFTLSDLNEKYESKYKVKNDDSCNQDFFSVIKDDCSVIGNSTYNMNFNSFTKEEKEEVMERKIKNDSLDFRFNFQILSLISSHVFLLILNNIVLVLSSWGFSLIALESKIFSEYSVLSNKINLLFIPILSIINSNSIYVSFLITKENKTNLIKTVKVVITLVLFLAFFEIIGFILYSLNISQKNINTTTTSNFKMQVNSHDETQQDNFQFISSVMKNLTLLLPVAFFFLAEVVAFLLEAILRILHIHKPILYGNLFFRFFPCVFFSYFPGFINLTFKLFFLRALFSSFLIVFYLVYFSNYLDLAKNSKKALYSFLNSLESTMKIKIKPENEKEEEENKKVQ